MSKFKWFLTFLWTFPLPLVGLLNRKMKLLSWRDHPVYVYHFWPSRRFALASWPTILVPRPGTRSNQSLMKHEARHLEQQRRWGGIIFLVSYGLMFVLLFMWHWNWRKAYEGVWWEVDARRAEEQGWRSE